MAVRDSDLVTILLVIIIFFSIFGAGLYVTSNVATQSDASDVVERTNSPLITAGESSTFESDTTAFSGKVKAITAVRETNGYQVRLRGLENSYYESDTEFKIASDGTWTVSSWAAFNSTYNTTNGTVYSLDGKVALQYDNTTQEWIGWYYNESTTNSYRITAVSSAQPNTLENVQLFHANGQFGIRVNGTVENTTDTNIDAIEDPLQPSSNWAGAQEELRGFDDNLTATQANQLVTDPVKPLPAANQTFRVMFDEGSGTTEPVYFTISSLTLYNTEWIDGFSGVALQENGLLTNGDYEINKDDGKITPLEGERLDGAPTVWVTYDFVLNPVATQWTETVNDGLILILIVPIVLVLGLIIGYFGVLRQSR